MGAKERPNKFWFWGTQLWEEQIGAICHKDYKYQTLYCLLGAWVQYVEDQINRLFGAVGEDLAVMVHIGKEIWVVSSGQGLQM